MVPLPLTNDQVQYHMYTAFDNSPVLRVLTVDQKMQLAREAAEHYQPRGKHRWRFEMGGQVFRTKKAYVESKELQQDRTLQTNRELRARCDRLQVVRDLLIITFRLRNVTTQGWGNNGAEGTSDLAPFPVQLVFGVTQQMPETSTPENQSSTCKVLQANLKNIVLLLLNKRIFIQTSASR